MNAAIIQGPTAWTDPDLTIVQACLPAQMLLLLLAAAKTDKVSPRADVTLHLTNAVLKPVAGLPAPRLSAILKKVDDQAQALLRVLSTDDVVEALYIVAMFVLVLVDEGLFHDPKNQAVLVALLFMEDAKDDAPDVKGQMPLFSLNELKLKNKAKDILRRAQLMGLYPNRLPSGAVLIRG